MLHCARFTWSCLPLRYSIRSRQSPTSGFHSSKWDPSTLRYHRKNSILMYKVTILNRGLTTAIHSERFQQFREKLKSAATFTEPIPIGLNHSSFTSNIVSIKLS